MSVFRSYFLKNSTIIKNNQSNNSQNPVTEISYGTPEKQVSRFIFDIDLDNLREKINQGLINPNKIVKHVLHMTNTISYAPQYLGKKSYSSVINRASGFYLELFKFNEYWDEGSGYDFIYNDELIPLFSPQASNWYSATTSSVWNTPGVFPTTPSAIAIQKFEKGNEDVEIDITDYINERLVETGTPVGGLGLKFTNAYESLETTYRQAVAFHVKNTNTWYEPYVETIIDDTITDDRNYFYLDKDNDLYLYANIGGANQDITVNRVNIYDYENNLIDTISGSSVVNVSKGIYKITLNVSSDTYPDAVMFRDEWELTINGKSKIYDNQFYLISQNSYITFDNSNEINLDNYHFNFWGIGEKEKITAGNIRKIKLTIKELYPNQNNFLPLDIEYRLFTTLGKKYEIDVIPFTSVNRTNASYEFNLDTSWLIPQDYFLQIRLKNGDYYENKKTLSFTVVSNGFQLLNKKNPIVVFCGNQFPLGFMYNDTLLYNCKFW